MKVRLFPYQREDVNRFHAQLDATKVAVSTHEQGLGKAQPVREPVLTPHGWQPIGKLKVGDTICTADGGEQTVVGIYPQGLREIYAVIFDDGGTTLCDAEHLWLVYDSEHPKRAPEVKSLAEIMRRGVKRKSGSHDRNRWAVPIAEPAHMKGPEMRVPGYTLGALIGDGHLNGITVSLSAPACKTAVWMRVKAEVERAFIGIRAHRTEYDGSCGNLNIVNDDDQYRNPFKAEMAALGLDVKSGERFIPTSVFVQPVDYRLNVLRGLMDTDGSCRRNRATYHSCCEALAKDVAMLARSLGMTAKLRAYDRTQENKGLEYQVSVRSWDLCPFFDPCKAGKWSPITNKAKKRSIVGVRAAGTEHAVCIAVSSPDRLYVTRHHVVTHNTLMAITLCDERKYRHVLVLCPAIARLSWRSEIQKWMQVHRDVTVIGGSKDIDKLRNRKPSSIVVCTYDLCRNDAVRETLCGYGFDFAILDEFQMLRNPDAKRTLAVYHRRVGVLAKIPDVMIMSGTPVVSWPLDMWAHLARFAAERIMDGDKRMTHEQFRDRYHITRRQPIAGKRDPLIKIVATRNLDDLRARVDGWAVRRRKADVLKDLPPMMVRDWPLEITPADRRNFMAMLEDELPPELVLRIRQAKTEAELAAVADLVLNGSPHVAKVVRICGVAKVPALLRSLKAELAESDYKLALMCWNHDVVDMLMAGLQEFRPVAITGKHSTSQRTAAVAAFMDDPACRVFVGQISACGTALTLTSCSRVLFPQLSWTPGDNAQAAARFHRIGQRDSVDVRIPTMPGSIDAAFNRVLSKKLAAAKEVVD